MKRLWGQLGIVFTHAGRKIEGRQILLPLPPSENTRLTIDGAGIKNYFNRYYSNSRKKSRGCLKNSTVYNQWLHAAAHALQGGKYPVLTDEVAVVVNFVFPDARRRDPQNYEKGFFDALTKGRVYEDDTQVTFHATKRFIIPNTSFCLAFVFKLNDMPELPIDVARDFIQQKAKEIEDYESAAVSNNP